MKCMGLSVGGEQRQLVPACILHILCRRGQRERETIPDNFIHSPLHTQRRKSGEKKRGAEGEA